MPKVPVLSGKQLIVLLLFDGWREQRRTRHGISLVKTFNDETRVTVVPDTRADLPDGTLGNILGVKQTRIGKKGLVNILNRYRQ